MGSGLAPHDENGRELSMLRSLAISTAAVLVLAVGIHCGGDDTEGGGGATPTGTTSTGSGSGGGSTGGTGGTSTNTTSSTTTSSEGGGQTGPLPSCDGSVEDEGACELGSLSCATATGCCECQEVLNCGIIWICADPPGESGCPASPPTFSEACTTEGQLCEYCNGPRVELWRCFNGTWVERMAGCVGPTSAP